MNFSHNTISLDGFAVTPMSRVTDAGTFSSAVSIRRGQGQASNDRVFRFTPQFPQQAQALDYALGQARDWLRSGRPG